MPETLTFSHLLSLKTRFLKSRVSSASSHTVESDTAKLDQSILIKLPTMAFSMIRRPALPHARNIGNAVSYIVFSHKDLK